MRASRKLMGDCFALPPGVDWTPVDVALGRLRGSLRPVVGERLEHVELANGMILAHSPKALRSSPPSANSAVDGYGFSFDSLEPGMDSESAGAGGCAPPSALDSGDSAAPSHGMPRRLGSGQCGNAESVPSRQRKRGTLSAPGDSGKADFAASLALVPETASAGKQHEKPVPKGQAIRILTGAPLPEGVDTIALDEETTVENGRVAFGEGIKRGANTREMGEDVKRGDSILSPGHRLRPQDLAFLTSAGISKVQVMGRLKAGVLSTGNELVQPGDHAEDAQVFDSNRPMLKALLSAWGYEAIDLGRVPDDASLLRKTLSEAAQTCDAIVTSGGASAGDEDHVSRLLREEGRLSNWRIAVKPGRPLALAQWQNVPIFGLPGNPVAALVCSLIFARPALSLMSGGCWIEPQGFIVPAAFQKNKKSGRREYLRARMNPSGEAEVFQSEGSGRISGLSWAGGLVELGDDSAAIRPGDPVRFIPYSSFGI